MFQWYLYRGWICSSCAYIRASICTSSACIGNAGTDVAGIIDTCAKRAYTRSASTGSTYTKDADTKGICYSAYIPSKSFIESSKLLIE